MHIAIKSEATKYYHSHEIISYPCANIMLIAK